MNPIRNLMVESRGGLKGPARVTGVAKNREVSKLLFMGEHVTVVRFPRKEGEFVYLTWESVYM